MASGVTAGALALGAAAIIGAIRAGGLGGLPELLMIVGSFALIAAFCGGYLVLYLRHYELFADDKHFSVVSPLGTRKVWDRAGLAEVLDVDYIVASTGYVGASRRYIFVTHEGRVMTQVTQGMVSPARMKTFCRHLGIPITRRTDIVTRRDLLKAFPRAFPWWSRHALLVGMGVGLLLFAVVFLVLALQPS